MTPGEWIETEVVRLLNAAPVNPSSYVVGNELPMSIEAVVDKMPRFELEDLTDLKVVVSSRSRSTSGGGRSSRKQEVALQIMLLKKLDSDFTELAALTELSYAIDMLVATYTQLGWTGSTNDPEYDTNALETHHVFQSVLTINFSSIT